MTLRKWKEKGDNCMSTLQRQVIQSKTEDKNSSRFMTTKRGIYRIGSLEVQKLIDSDYDIDECNDEIEKMFLVFGK